MIPQQCMAKPVNPKVGDHVSWRHLGQIAALGHLLAAQQQIAMNVVFRHRFHTGRHQHRWPIDRVETQDVFGHEVPSRWPPGIEAFLVRPITHCGRIVDQSIEPYVEHMLVVPRNGNSPVDRRAGHRYIFEAQTK